MKSGLLLLLIFFLSCGGKTESSFSSLYESFEVWYFKNHPVISTHKNYKKYDNTFRLNDFKTNERYLLDMKRFYFELTQINYSSLNYYDQIKYDRIKKTLLKLIYVNEELKEQEWKPSIKLIELYNGIEYLLYYNSDEGMSSLNKRLSQIESILDQTLINLSYISEDEYSYCLKVADSMIKLLKNIQFEIDYRDKDYENILNSANAIIIQLNQYILNLKSIMQQFENNFSIDVFNDRHFRIITESENSINETYMSAKRNLDLYHLKLFENTIDIFLENNDEPIWIDYDDTLKVIHTVIDKIEKENRVNNFNYIKESFDESGYESYMSPKFSYYINSYDFLYIDEDLDMIVPPKNSYKSNRTDIQINLPAIEIPLIFDLKEDSLNSFNKIQLDLLNAFKLYPGSGYINSNISSDNLTYKIPNKTTLRGLQRYSERVFIKTNKMANTEHQIIHEKNILRDICSCILDVEYNIDKISDENMSRYLIDYCFLSDFEANKVINKIKNNYFGYSSIGYIGYQKILSLENLHLNKTNPNYMQFYNQILQNGVVDLENLAISFE